MTKRRRGQDEGHRHHHHHHNHHHQQDDDFIPLPIQTFLWRQTSPFVRPFLGKARDLAQIEQRDACKLFERIIITNNIWGQSPSLTDAISSIDRWRLIKVSFPFVLQCTAALLNNKLIKDHNFNRLGGNEAKMMYTLQWILMNASEECADSENEAKSNATNVAIAAATAASLLKPMDSQMGQGSGGSGAAGGAAGGLGASVGVSGQASNSGQLSSRLDQQAAGTSGANTSSSGQTNQSIVMPAAAAVVAIGQPAGLTTLQTSAQQQQQQQQQSQAPQPQVPLQQQQQHPNSSSSVSPIGSSTPTQAAVSTVPPGQASTASATAATSCPALQASSPNKYLLPISSIQMFAYYFAPIMDGLKHSDFLSSNQRLEIGAALWEPLFNYQLPDIHCLKARIKRDPSQEVIEQQTLISEPAMRQQQQQQQQPTLLTTNITTKPAGGEYSIQAPTTIVTGAHQGGATLTSTIGDDRRRSSSVFNDPAHFGDVFLGGPTPTIAASTPEDPTLSRASGTGATGASMSAHMEQSILLTKSSPATYLDVAILRCLFVSDWQESGVYWAINYLSNRFNEDLYINKQADEDEGDDDDDDEYSFDDDEFSGGNEHLQQQQVRGVRGNIVAGRRRAKATRLARLMRKSKSLSCVSSDDLRRSLTLRRDHFKRQRGQLQNTTGADKTMSQDSSGADPRLEQQQTSSSSSSRFLRVEDTSESGLGGGGATTGGDQKERGEPKSPIRRLSFSSGMQTLANQIRKTSKRVKKGPDERQTSGENLNPAAQQATSSSQTNINTAAASALGAQSGCEQSTTSSTTRLSRHRRSSSADNLSLSQVSALSVLSQQQDRQMTDSNPVITVTPNSNTAIAAAAATSGTSGACTGQQQPSASKTPRSASPTGEKHRKRTRKTKTRGDTFESGDTATAEVRGAADTTTTTRESLDQSTIGHDDGGARQYLMQSLYLRSLKHFERLTRSHTIPANMRFVAAPLSELQPGSLDKSESLGADFYVDERGRIDPLVVLKIIHSISQRDNACSLRVCDKVLFLMNRLINIGILSDQGGRRGRRRSSAAAGFVLEDRANLLPTRRQHEFNLLHRVVHVPSSSGGARRESTTTGGDDREMLDSVRQNLIHKVLIDIVFRLHHHLGCPNHCGMPSTVDHHHKGQQNFRQKVSSFSGGRQTLAATTGDNLIASGKNLRLSLRDSLEYLSAFNKQSFIKYVQDVFTDRDLRHVVDILHSLLGFCRPDYLSYLKHRNQTGTAAATGAGGGSGAATTTTTTTTTTGQASHTTVQFATASGVIGGGKATQPAATATMDSAATATAATVVNALQAKRRKSLPALDPVESIIVTNSFKQLVTRMASMTKELKMAQNNSLYCDIRRLINFIRENYNSTFRSIVLSALIDCTRFLNKQQQQQQQHRESNQSEVALRTQQQHNQQQQQQHHQQQQQTLTRPSSEEESLAGGVGPSQTTTTTTSRDKRASDKQILSTDEELSTTDTTSIHHQSQHGASQMSGVVAGSASSSHQHQPRTSMSSHRFQATASPSHMGRSATIQGSGSPTQGQSVGGAHEARESSTTTGILSLSKAKKKLEQVFGGGGSSGAVSSGGSKLKLGDELNLSTGGGSLGGGGGGAGQLQTTDLTAETTNQSYNSGPEESSRRASLVGHQSIVSMGGGEHQALVYPAGVVGAASIGPLSIQIIKQNQLIYETVQAGMSNFAFLMESCLPGDFLDPALLAALLDLKSPIAIRAAVFLECANFVHRCNRGQWPSWMRMNLAPSSGGGGQRASNAGFMPGMASSKMRKSSSVQRTARNNTLMYRAAGRAFYAWAEAVGARLEELLADSSSENSSNDQQQQQSCQDGSTTADGRQASLDEHNKSHRQRCSHQSSSTPNQTNSSNLANETLLMQDVDFLQPTLANDSSPFVLKMAACQLLFEVTTFLRETYRYLPPTIVQHQIAGSGKTGDKMSSIYDVSRAVTANRRWSMALSSLGFGQLPATLSNLGALTSGGGNVAPPQQPASNTSGASLRANPASTSLSEQPERRISFILHETKGEDQIREEEEEEEGDGGDETARKQRDSVPATSGTGGGDSSSASHHYDMQSIAGSEHEAAASNSLRRITSGSSGRHLSQSSASSAVVVAAATLLRSSGVIESQTHRRKSIKLKKSGQDKEKQDKKTKFSVGATSAGVGGGPGSSGQTGDFDEELENSSLSDVGGMRRTDSMRSRRRVSGISDTSANGLASSTTTNQTGGALVGTSGGAGAQESTGTGGAPTTGAAGELSGNESAGNGSVAGCDDHLLIGGTEGSLGKFEADESKIMSHMPWFKAISLVNSSIDCDCSHFPSCKPSCYKLHQSTCKRLISFVQTIYKDPTEQNYLSSIFEKRLANLISDQKQLHKQQKQASSSSSDHHHHHHHKSQHGSKSGAIFRAGSDCSGADSGEPSQWSHHKKKDKKLKKRSQPTVEPTAAGQQQQQLVDQEQSLSSPKMTTTSSKHHPDSTTTTGAGSKTQATMMIGRHHHHGFSASHMHGGSGGGHGGHGCKLQPTSVVDETINILRAAKAKERTHEEPPMIKYLRSNVRSLLHCPMSSFLKGAIILPRESFAEMIRFSWNLLLEDDQQLSRTAAVCFIVSAIKCPNEASKLLIDELESTDASRKMAAINKFYVVWDARYQCWPRLEDGAFVHFKMAPPSIEFTLPSPKIAQESSPVVDPPWMPRKTSNVEEVTIGQDQTVQKSFVTATKTRRKQQIEIVTKALREKHDKLREDREIYNITSVPVTLYAAFEPTLGNQGSGGLGGPDGELDGSGGGGGGATADEDAQQENRALFQMKTAQALFPTCLCQSAIVMINLLDDPRVTYEGSAVYEIASKVIWSCLVEDPALFLRYFFERLTRQNQSTIFQVLRRLIRFMPRLPPQAAYTLYNYLIGFIIYYIRCPFENSQKLISDTLSVLCLVVPSVHGLFLKDLKQILRKEQCDHNLLITANVPSAKKIIIHGSDSSGIPSQFPIDESTQFYHVLVDSLEFFGIDKSKQNEYFLIDVRTNLMHNLHSYVRDYYSFKRSQHPQLQLINMNPSKAFDILQRQELVNQFMEFGKVLMSLSIVKSSHMAVQRALFLHEELMKLPTFPRKALETNFSLFRGPLGHQVFSMDRIHKICWVRVIARMFELTSGFFLQLGDIQLFLNAISGIFVLHCEEASVSRLCLATFINATHQFKSIFATDGFMPIMSTIVQVYSNHQNNQLLCKSIEYVCKQFYIMHRKPFLLQLFGSVASKLNTAEILQHNQITSPVGLYQLSYQSQQQQQQQFGQQSGSSSSALGVGSGGGSASVGANSSSANTTSGTSGYIQLNDPNRISPSAFFRLLLSLEKAFKDPLDILELVDIEKPLRAVDFCYQQDKESIDILDIISLCVTVTAYASESPRSTQMLIILESVVPLYMKHLQASTSKKAGQSMGKQAHKDELQKIQSISICIRTLIVNCEGLTRNFNGPLASFDFRSSSIRRTGPSGNRASRGVNANNSAGSPLDIYADEPSLTGPELSGKQGGGGRNKSSANEQTTGHGHSGGGKQTTFATPASKSKSAASGAYNNDETEITRGEFIVPRDTLLNLVAEFLSLSTGRLVESAKKYVELHQKHSSYELLDVKSHLRLAEVANSLLKFASTDPSVMACRGLIRYMNEILPNTEWRQEAIRPALIMILKRLDKTFNRIAKKNWVKKSTDWEAAKELLKGAYLTFIKHPYIVHLPHLKSLISCCQNIILSDGLQSSPLGSNLLHGFASAASTAVASSTAGATVTGQQQQQQQQQGQLTGLAGAAGQSGSGSGPMSQTPGAGGKFQASASNLLSVGHQGTSGRFGKSSSPSLSSAGGAGATSGPTGFTTDGVPLSSSSPAGSGAAGGGSSQQATPSLAAVTAAAALAERLASGAGTGSSITSQGFNSVTIRLIAMQLLQTGDSQTLESFIGNSMNTPEKLESLMLNLIYPMSIRVCSGAREAPKLRVCDIMFILNIVLQMLAPQSASSKSCSSFANSPKSTTDTSQFILSKITTTIGSTQTGATALNIVGGSSSHSQASAHQISQHPEALKIGFLGLKILCVCFESQLASEWVRISRVIRDLSLHSNQPSNPLWDFLDFVATYRFPMFVLLLPTIKCDIAKKVKQLEQARASGGLNSEGPASACGLSMGMDAAQLANYRQNLSMIEAKIHGSTPTVFRSKSFLFVSLTAELRMLKEQLIAKRKQQIDGERNQHHHNLSGQTSGASGGGGGHGGGASGSGHSGAGSSQGAGSSALAGSGQGPSAGLGSGSSDTGGDHFGGAYHRLSAAIASFANQSQMGKLSPSASAASSQLGTSAALKGACFAAQLATSAAIGPQVSSSGSGGGEQPASSQSTTAGAGGGGSSQSSIRLSTAKSREEARKVMNTILRRTSYPHNQPTNLIPPPSAGGSEATTSGGAGGGGERKGSQPASPSMSMDQRRQAPLAEVDIEAGQGGDSCNQIIMDPAMLIKAAFPAAPRKSNVEGSGILKQLVQTIDRQNTQRQMQQLQRNQRTYRPTAQDQRAACGSNNGNNDPSTASGRPGQPTSHVHEQNENDENKRMKE